SIGGTSGCCATCLPSEGPSVVFVPGRLAPVPEEALDLLDILVADALATAIAATQAVEDMLPHRPRRFQVLRPVAASLQFPFEAPRAGPLLGAQEAPLSRLRVGIGP